MKSITCLLCLALLSSCSKQLDVLPTTQVVDGNAITDQNSAQTALNGAYYLFAAGGEDYLIQVPTAYWFETNEVRPSFLSGMYRGDYYYGSSDFITHIIQSTSGDVRDQWKYAYTVVNAANGLFKNINPVNNIVAADKKRILAEASFLRAYANAQLLFYFGEYKDLTSAYGILLRKEFLTNDNIPQPRSPVKDCYDFIMADLDNAIAGLPGRNTHICYANQWAAKLLKARILMMRGATGDYSQVISLCQDIIANSPFALEDSTKDIFLSKGLNSKEVMLGIQPYPNQTMKFQFYYGGLMSVAVSPLMDSLFQNDPRRAWMIRPGTVMLKPGNFMAKYCPGSDPLNNLTLKPTPVTENSYVFRLTEAYLLQAEAITASGGSLTEAKALLKTVWQHAGVQDFSSLEAAHTASAVQEQIIVEEMKNLVGEAGQDWLAVRRLPFATLQKLIPSITSPTQPLLPIPHAEMVGNAALKGMQNPGYGN